MKTAVRSLILGTLLAFATTQGVLHAAPKKRTRKASGLNVKLLAGVWKGHATIKMGEKPQKHEIQITFKGGDKVELKLGSNVQKATYKVKGRSIHLQATGLPPLMLANVKLSKKQLSGSVKSPDKNATLPAITLKLTRAK